MAELVWEYFGDVRNYVDPFAASLAVPLARPHWDTTLSAWRPGHERIETVNDLNCHLANFWRAVRGDPEAVARWADYPVSELDLQARHVWLDGQGERLRDGLRSDPDFYDARAAGWWLWGASLWIGARWCSGRAHNSRQRPHLSDHGNGVHSLRLRGERIRTLLADLAARLRYVRIVCGDWQRAVSPCVLWPAPLHGRGPVGVFLDPPYDQRERNMRYAEDRAGVAAQVRAWALAHGSDTRMRIALCGFEGEHDMPSDWTCVPWKGRGGMGNQTIHGFGRANTHRERIWFSPHCFRPERDGGPSLGI